MITVAKDNKVVLPHKFSPGLRQAIEDAISHPSQASVFTTSEIQEVYERGVARGRELAEADQPQSALVIYLAWFVAGSLTLGVIGFLGGLAVAGF